MRSVMRRTVAAVGVWGVLLACWLSAVSPAWSQVAGKGAGAASRDPAFDSHLPWIFRERSQSILDENVVIRFATGWFCVVDAASRAACGWVQSLV